ncbi:carbohydrate ABC transporter permease [Paenibacillus eucommiae]|uniref:Multiple sugar transport system permease protein/raffinose/stachyose/melibiose transport system permease protein n=1 Tax=Paenibacillus eucommiae TaxID=1355755 RepID=A0ABS4J5E9_9BACL|nr:carbohydrate ABC transporter permease [Paenibacillus eucommiae]MBP1994486.1 multiple sugar transport system permease protein/raffinose/stachyose/melibiose transport system permease protein [Paenibacillus eucommiae]
MKHRALDSAFLIRHTVILFFGILTVLPFFVLLSLSFKDSTQFNLQRWSVTFPFHWENYDAAWQAIHVYIGNSFVISGVTVIGVLVISCLAAYPLARIHFFMKEKIYFLIIALLMIPFTLTMVPLFSLVIEFRILNSWLGLWGPYIASGQVFCIFVLRSFFSSLSEEMFEAARVDGASEMRILFSIVLPLSKAIIATLGVLNVLNTWNDYIWPVMVINDDRLMPLTIGLMVFQKQFTTDWGPLFAGYVIASIPLLIMFIFASKQFVEGLSSGSVKM